MFTFGTEQDVYDERHSLRDTIPETQGTRRTIEYVGPFGGGDRVIHDVRS